MYTVRHTLSLHDALPVCYRWFVRRVRGLGLGSLHKEARPRPEVISPIPTTRWGILWLEGGKGTIYSSIYRFDITVVRIEEPVSYRHIPGRILDLPQVEPNRQRSQPRPAGRSASHDWPPLLRLHDPGWPANPLQQLPRTCLGARLRSRRTGPAADAARPAPHLRFLAAQPRPQHPDRASPTRPRDSRDQSPGLRQADARRCRAGRKTSPGRP